MPTDSEGHQQTGHGDSAEPGRTGDSEEAGKVGDPAATPFAEQAGSESGDTENDGVAALPESDDDPGESGTASSGSHQAEARPQVQRPAATSGSGKRIPDRDFHLAFRECKGNVMLMARVLGIRVTAVTERIKRDPALSALRPHPDDQDNPTAPSVGETLLRSPDELPIPISDPQLGSMVIKTETALLKHGLAKLGVSDKTIAKLKTFEGLNIGAGQILAQSLQQTHQLYYLRLLQLDKEMDEIQRRYLNEDATEQTNPMERMFWQKAYNEMVDQYRKGYLTMLSGTQAMVAMMKAQNKDKPAGQVKSKPGW